MQNPAIIIFTGLPGIGRTTLSRRVAEAMCRQHAGDIASREKMAISLRAQISSIEQMD
jgi:tRNA uridine 5-carbamoylmethylation protein Kti12